MENKTLNYSQNKKDSKMTTITALMLISIFVLVYICTVYALGQSELRSVRFALAFPVSMLCVLSFLRGGENQEKPMLDLILIPYQALAYTFLFIIVLLVFFLLRPRILRMLRRRHIRILERRCVRIKEDIDKKHRTATNRKKRLKEN